MRWRLELDLSAPGEARPLFVQVAEGISAAIQQGRLAPGSALPGSRALATHLGVHRNTVLAAFAELCAEGWLEARGGSGTYVSQALPGASPQRFGTAPAPRNPARLGFWVPPPPRVQVPQVPPGALAFGSTPDTASVPWPPLARALRRALQANAARLLDYGDPRGEPGLRAALADMLAHVRGLNLQADDVMVTRGSQMGLYLAARAILAPGDAVAVEALGYRPAWAAFEGCGARLHGVAIDAEGIDVEALAAVHARHRLRAVYVTPHHQYPTTVSLSPARRLALLRFAEVEGVALIEDDYDHEFHYENRPLTPLASADRAGVVIYVGTLSKVLAPGLRVGFLVAPRPVLERAAALRLSIDRQGDLLTEKALAELFEDGEIQRHIRRMRGVHRAHRDQLVRLLRTHLGGALDFEVPRGGLAVWARVDPALDLDSWVANAAACGLFLWPGRQHTLDDQPIAGLRLGFARHDAATLDEAVRRLVASCPRGR